MMVQSLEEFARMSELMASLRVVSSGRNRICRVMKKEILSRVALQKVQVIPRISITQ